MCFLGLVERAARTTSPSITILPKMVKFRYAYYLNGLWESLDLCLDNIKTSCLHLPEELYSVEDSYL
jgi:hypothetical protein